MEWERMDKPLRDLIEIVHFTENVSVKIHGVLDEAEIYRAVREEFAKSKRYTASILLLTDDGSKLGIAGTSIASEELRAGEKAAGVRLKGYKIDLDKSSIYSQAVREGETVQVNVSDIIGELFPRPLAYLISKTMGYEKTPSILTPLKRRGKIIGALGVSSTELAGHFIPSVRNLGQHISNALELADEYAKRKRAEEELRKYRDHLEEVVEERTAELIKANEQLQREITERKRAEERVEHLNLVLRAIRNVNQLITRERDRDRLLQGACDNLIETRGYHSVWIALLDESRGLVTSAEAGLGEEFLPLVEQLKRGELPACGQMALSQAGVVVIEDRASTCAGCPLSKNHSDMAAMAVRLEHSGKVYGVLTVSTPTDFIADEEERFLFQEVAADIAFALHSIELEKERKRAEEALRVSEERFTLAVRGSEAGLWDWDIQNNSLYWSPRLKELLGYADDELDVDFDTFESHLHPDDREHTGAAIEAHLKDRELYEVEQRLRTKSGEYRWFRARGRGLWDEAGNPVRVVGFITDITERKRAEEAQRESEERLDAFMDSAPDAFILFDSELNLVETNKAALEMLPAGIKKEDVIGKNILDISPGLKETGRYDRYLKVIKTGEPLFIEDVVPVARFVGDRHLAVKVFKVGDGLGMITTDITERVRAEEALKEYSERLEEMVEERTRKLQDAQERLVRRERLAVLGQLAGGVGHELRNPLGVISNAVYYLKTVLTDADETTREFLDIISAEVRNSSKIISDLLDFSRTRMPDREEVAVSELVAQVLKKRPPPEEVEVITEFAPDLPPVFVDPRQMGQVLGNLVTNAYQAMKEGGKLTISAQAEEGQVSISVGDTGCGISPENMAKLFEPLFTTKSRGIGLGLAVSRSLVEANGGSIEVESEVGKGSTFTVRLPVGRE